MIRKRRIDYNIVLGDITSLVFTISNADGTPYDMTGNIVNFILNDINNTEVLNKPAINVGLGTFEVSISNTESDNLGYGKFFYICEEVIGSAPVTVAYGEVDIVDLVRPLPFIDIIETETPAGMVIPEEYIHVNEHYWRLYLQNLISTPISDAFVLDETMWPTLANFLIGKLVIYSFLDKNIKAMVNSSTADDQGAAQNLKKLETGPSNAEWYDSFDSISEFLKPDSQGFTGLQRMANDICQLAHRLRVNLPMICKKLPHSPIIPEVQKRVLPDDPITILTNFTSNKSISQG